MQLMRCEHCGAPFVRFRKDKRFCSQSCKIKNYRRIQKEQLDYIHKVLTEKVFGSPKLLGPDLFT